MTNSGKSAEKNEVTNAVKNTEIFIVRHGVTSWNQIGRLQGHTDIDLSALGIAQAKTLIAPFKLWHLERSFTCAYTSDLSRAINTAAPCTQAIDLEIAVDPIWRERGFGVLEGLDREQMLAQHPAVVTAWKSGQTDYQLPDSAQSIGESVAQFYARIEAGINDLLARHVGQRVLLVTHGGVVDMVRRMAQGLPLGAPRGYDIPNASVGCVAHDGERFSMPFWLNTDHLNSEQLHTQNPTADQREGDHLRSGHGQ